MQCMQFFFQNFPLGRNRDPDPLQKIKPVIGILYICTFPAMHLCVSSISMILRAFHIPGWKKTCPLAKTPASKYKSVAAHCLEIQSIKYYVLCVFLLLQ